MKSKIMPSLTLGAICLVVALLLALVNLITAPVIENNLNEKNMEALRVVMPDAKDLKPTEAYKDSIDPSITTVWEGTSGYVFQINTIGKSSGMVILVGISPEGKITGTKCTANNETPGYAKPVFSVVDNGYYAGQSSADFNAYLVSGSTLTSSAYANAVEAALSAYETIKGGN